MRLAQKAEDTELEKPATKVAIIFDAEQMIHAQRKTETSIDQPNLKDFLLNNRDLGPVRYHCNAKTGLTPQLEGFLLYLGRNGFEVIKETEEDDVDSAIDKDIKTFNEDDSISTIILASGDGDHIEAIKNAKENGKTIEIFSLADMLHGELRKLADRVINPIEHRDELIDERKTADQYPEIDADADSVQLVGQLMVDNEISVVIRTTNKEIIIKVGDTTTLMVNKPEIPILNK